MKKLITSVVLCSLIFASAASATIKKATIVNGSGQKMVINVGDSIPAGFHLMGKNTVGGATPDTLYVKRQLVGTNASMYNFASTTAFAPYWIATSTSVMASDYIFDVLSLNVKVTNASTTAANTITISPTFSNDDNCSTNVSGVNWFTSSDAANNQISTSSSYAANTTTLKTYRMTGLAHKCIRLITSASFASSTIFIEGVAK